MTKFMDSRIRNECPATPQADSRNFPLPVLTEP